MIIINDKTKQQFQKEIQELKELNLTYQEYKFLQEKGIELLMSFENDFQKNLEYIIRQSYCLNYLLSDTILAINNTIVYGYGLIVNTPPPEICDNPKLLEEFKAYRKNIYINLKEDFLQGGVKM
jgi:hypothetical protein